MRILIVVHGYPPTHTGGAELRAERTARGLLAGGHDVAVLCVESFAPAGIGTGMQEHMQEGVLVRYMRLQYADGVDNFRQQYDHPDIAAALADMMRIWRPDIVHLFSGYLTGMGVIHTATAFRVPVVVSLTDYWWLCHRIIMVRTNGARCSGPTPSGCARCHWEIYRRARYPSRFAPQLTDSFWALAERWPALGQTLGLPDHLERQRALSKALAMADALIAPSQVLANIYISHGIDARQVHVLRQGVDLDACPIRRPSPALRFGYFGQIKRHKGIHTLIDAWRRLTGPQPRSLILYGSDRGEEHYAARLREESRSMPNVTWAPPVSHTQIWQALAEVEVLVVPSRWLENSPNIILEAQAMGVVVIGTNLGGIAELVQDGRNGLLFEPDNAADLAAQMQRMLDEPGMIEHLRRNSIPFGSFAHELEQIESLYAACVNRAQQQPHQNTPPLKTPNEPPSSTSAIQPADGPPAEARAHAKPLEYSAGLPGSRFP